MFSLPESCGGHILYVHGGPGFHSAFFEAAVNELPNYRDGTYGWICYNQRGGGRSSGGEQSPNHQNNIRDLAALIRYCRTPESGCNLLAVMGHSYGGWLAYHTLTENPDLSVPLIVVASAKDMRTARNRSFALDMAELRMAQPDVYRRFFSGVKRFSRTTLEFSVKDRTSRILLRDVVSLCGGILRYHGLVQGVKKRIGMPENWDLTRQISSTTGPEYSLKAIDPDSRR